MSGYSDQYKSMQQEAFLREWTPDGVGSLKVTEDNLRWNLAKRRAAEDELKRLKDALRVLKDAIR